MAVEITGITTTPLSDNKTNKANTTPANTNNPNNTGSVSASTASAPTSDTVTLTQRAEELRMIEQNVNSQTGIDSERVETLKIAIDSGRYDIDPLRVAEKLIAFETQFVA